MVFVLGVFFGWLVGFEGFFLGGGGGVFCGVFSSLSFFFSRLGILQILSLPATVLHLITCH